MNEAPIGKGSLSLCSGWPLNESFLGDGEYEITRVWDPIASFCKLSLNGRVYETRESLSHYNCLVISLIQEEFLESRVFFGC